MSNSGDDSSDGDGDFLDHDIIIAADNDVAADNAGNDVAAAARPLGALSPPQHDDDYTGGGLRVMVLDVMFMNQDVVLFGRAARGDSVALFVGGWQPYLCIEAPQGFVTATACEHLRDQLNEKVETRIMAEFYRKQDDGSSDARKPFFGGSQKKGEPPLLVTSVSFITAKNILGYDPSPPKPFLKICVSEPRWTRHLRECFETLAVSSVEGGGARLVYAMDGTKTFNSHVESTLQFMVDAGMYGCQWCDVGPVREDAPVRPRLTVCGVERHGLRVGDLKFLTEEEEGGLVAPLRLLSFDIEAAGRRGVFPQASLDPVIQISLQFKVIGQSEQPLPILLSFKQCDPIDGAVVLSFDSEDDMLLKFRDLVLEFDTDVFTGFNVCNFDWLYLRDRAVALGCSDEFERITKIAGGYHGKMFLRETVYQSVQMGKRKRVKVSIPGRVCVDMLTAIQNNHKLDKYTLNAVSAYFLGDTKVDLPFTQITPLWMKDSGGRKELGIYCLKDAELPLALMEKLDSLTQTMEMARCAGIPLDWVLQRGILIRNTSLLLRRALVRGYLFPYTAPKPELDSLRCQFQGATVLDAVCGIHGNVGVLDFSAMYPTIVRAHNLDFSTYLPPPPAPPPNVPYEQHSGQRFVTADVVKGLLPEVVEHLGNCRNKAKAAYAAATDPTQKRISKARELAFKVPICSLLCAIF